MPIARIQAPDGKTLRIEVPEGASEQDIMSFVQNNYKPQQELSAGQEIARPVARAVRSGLAGIAGIADIGGAAVEPIRQGMRKGLEAAGVDFMGQDTQYVPPSEAVKNLFDELTGGIAKPRNDAEKITDVAGEAVSGGGIMKGVQTGAKLLSMGGEEILKKLAPQTGSELISIAGAGAGTEIARQLDPENPIVPVVGGVIGGVSTVKGMQAIRESGDIKLLDKAYFNRQAQRNPDVNHGYFSKQASKILAKNLNASPEKLESLKQQLIQDKNFVLPDIGGDEVRALTRQVGKYRGGSRNDVDKFFTQRDKGAGQRLINAINNDVSGVDKYYGTLDELSTVRSELAKDQYTSAYNTHKVMKATPTLQKFIEDGRFQNALADARKEGLINIEQPVNSLQTLDAVYRRLRDKAGDFAAKNQNDAAIVYGDFARDFVKRLDIEAPEYRKARNTFAGMSELIDAQKMGRDYLRMRPEQLKAVMNDMTIGERDAFKIGVRENIEQRILTSGMNQDEAAKIFGKAENRQQLKVILGDQYNDFARKARSEIRRAETKFKVLGGSRTDYNQIEDGAFIDRAVNLVRNGKVGIVDEAYRTISDAIKNKYLGINENNARILTKVLTNNKQGIRAIDSLIARERNNSTRKLLKQFKQDYSYLLVPTAGAQ